MLCLLSVGPTYLNHDVAWYLHVAREWMEGATLYRDVVDTNPPLIIWLSAPPAALAEIARWGAPALFKGYVVIIAALALAAVRGIVRRAWPDLEFPVLVGAAFLCLPFAKEDFGQREHLAVLLSLPYVIASVAGTDVLSRRGAFAIGVVGGLGFAIKPYFFAAWAAVEIVALTTMGWRALRRPAFVAAVVTILTYVLAVVTLMPQYLEVIERVRHVYGALNAPGALLLRLREVQLWILAVAVIAGFRWQGAQRITFALFAAGSGYLFAGLVQMKGWAYQLYPARIFLLLFLIVTLAALLRRVPEVFSVLRGGQHGVAAVFALSLMAASARYALEARNPVSDDFVTPMIRAIKSYAPDGPVALLAMRTHLYPAFPAINYTRAEWSLRYNALFFLPGLYEEQNKRSGGPLDPRRPGDMTLLESQFFEEVIEDLCTRPPRLLVIDRPPASAAAGRRALDLRAYYAQSPRAQQLLEGYRTVEEAGPYLFLIPGRTLSCGPGGRPIR